MSSQVSCSQDRCCAFLLFRLVHSPERRDAPGNTKNPNSKYTSIVSSAKAAAWHRLAATATAAARPRCHKTIRCFRLPVPSLSSPHPLLPHYYYIITRLKDHSSDISQSVVHYDRRTSPCGATTNSVVQTLCLCARQAWLIGTTITTTVC